MWDSVKISDFLSLRDPAHMNFYFRYLPYILTALFSFSITAQAAQTGKLIFAIDVIRHGDRTPVIQLPAQLHHWPQGLGQLTPNGMQQLFQLGQTFRKRYIMQHKLLPKHFNVKTLYVASTNFDRTRMSAYSFLAGLYPLGTGPTLPHNAKPALPYQQQPIPIHTISGKLISKEQPRRDRHLLEEYVFSQSAWQQKVAELQPHYRHWSQLTGIDIKQPEQLITIGDTLFIFEKKHLSRPNHMTTEDARQMIAAGTWLGTTIFKTPEIGKRTGQNLLAKITHDLLEGSKQKTPLRQMLYFAHDSTILSLMSVMHVPLNYNPPYASDLNFSLWKMGHNDYRVKISLNNKPVILPACGAAACKLTQLLPFAKKSANAM